MNSTIEYEVTAMNCWNCQGEVQHSSQSCPWCGAPAKQPEKYKSITDIDGFEDDTQPKKKKWKKRILSISILLFLSLSVGIYFGIFHPKFASHVLREAVLKNRATRTALGIAVPLPKLMSKKCEQDLNQAPNPFIEKKVCKVESVKRKFFGFGGVKSAIVAAGLRIRNKGKTGKVSVDFFVHGIKKTKVVSIYRHDDRLVTVKYRVKLKSANDEISCRYNVKPVDDRVYGRATVSIRNEGRTGKIKVVSTINGKSVNKVVQVANDDIVTVSEVIPTRYKKLSCSWKAVPFRN